MVWEYVDGSVTRMEKICTLPEEKKSLSQEAAEYLYFERHLKFFLLFWSSNGERLLGFFDHHQADLVANAFFVESFT